MQCCSHAMRGTAAPFLPARQTTAPLAAASCRPAAQRQRGVAAHALPVAGISSAVLIGAAYWLAQQQQMAEQDQLEASDRRPCPSCGGSGLQPCACTRWSDGDVGCSTCSQSGWMKCSSCGGGGTAVPIKVSIRRGDGM